MGNSKKTDQIIVETSKLEKDGQTFFFVRVFCGVQYAFKDVVGDNYFVQRVENSVTERFPEETKKRT